MRIWAHQPARAVRGVEGADMREHRKLPLNHKLGSILAVKRIHSFTSALAPPPHAHKPSAPCQWR